MYKKLFSFFVMLLISIGIGSNGLAQIIIEGASSVLEESIESPVELPEIPQRFVCEYVTTIHHQIIDYPEELISVTSSVPSRIVVEYASAIAHFDLNTVTVCDWSLCIFAADFGKTDCNTGEPCEYDYDGDGDVDGFDLAEFSTNF